MSEKRRSKTAKRGAEKRVKAGRKTKPEPITTEETKAMAVKEDSLFEFYKIFPHDTHHTGAETELCKPPCQRVGKANLQTTLATVCAEAYGEGDFIALEAGGASEGQAQGLPFAYWLIRVKPNKHGIPCRKAEQIALADEDHEHLNTLKRHPALMRASEEDEQWERDAGATEEETGKVIEIEGRPYVVDRDELVKFDHKHDHHFRNDPWAAFFRDYASSRGYQDSDEWRRLGDPYQWQRGTCAGQMAAKYFDLIPNPQAGEGITLPEFKEDPPRKNTRQRTPNNPLYGRARKLFPGLLKKYANPTRALHQLIVNLGEPGYNTPYRSGRNGQIRTAYKRALRILWKNACAEYQKEKVRTEIVRGRKRDKPA